MTLLFRREVTSFLSTAPSQSINGAPVEVLAAVERLSSSGLQSSVQLCRAGEETWVTRTEGNREYFPRVGRVQKRVRGGEEEEEEVAAVGDDERQGLEEGTTRTPKKSKDKKSKSTPTPRQAEARKTRSVPKAPSKSRSAAPAVPTTRWTSPTASEIDAASLRSDETMRRAKMEVHEALGEELGRGKRRCNRRGTEESEINVKTEEGDELASLCGRVLGLDVKSAIDTGQSIYDF